MMQYRFTGSALPLAGAISRMGIAHHARLKGINLLHHRQRGAPLRFDALVTEIAKMLAQHRLVAAHQAEGVFHLRPGAQHGGNILKPGRQRDGIRHKTARGAASRHPIHHRIIHPLQDIAVMQQKAVGNVPELVQRLRLVMAGGLPLRLPEVITSGRWQSIISKCCSGLASHDTIQTRRNRLREGSQAFGVSTMGAAGERSSA
jgi:hypothetical protein